LMICTARGLWRLVMNVLKLFDFVYSCIALFSSLHNIKPTFCSYVIHDTFLLCLTGIKRPAWPWAKGLHSTLRSVLMWVEDAKHDSNGRTDASVGNTTTSSPRPWPLRPRSPELSSAFVQTHPGIVGLFFPLQRLPSFTCFLPARIFYCSVGTWTPDPNNAAHQSGPQTARPSASCWSEQSHHLPPSRRGVACPFVSFLRLLECGSARKYGVSFARSLTASDKELIDQLNYRSSSSNPSNTIKGAHSSSPRTSYTAIARI
jgi:hypothetical protein